MKEKILKMAELNKEIVSLIKEEKMDEVIEKSEEVAKLQKELEEEAEKLEEGDSNDGGDNGGEGDEGWEGWEGEEGGEKVEKSLEERVEILEKMFDGESIKKRASLSVNADDLGKLMEELADAKTKIAKMEGKLEVVEKYTRWSTQEAVTEKNVWAD